MKYYFKHYALINKIDLASEETIKTWFRDTEKAFNYELLRFLEDNYQSKFILDLGCGIGGILNFLKQRGCKNILGVDNSVEQVEICRKFVTDKVVKADLFDFLSSNSKKYDIIIMLDILEHIHKNRVVELLQLVYKTLNINGKLIIRTPNMGCIIATYLRHLDFTHETGFTSESLHQVLSEAEFADIKFFNSAIGRKRIYLMKFIHKILSFLYRTRFSGLVTANILATARKIL